MTYKQIILHMQNKRKKQYCPCSSKLFLVTYIASCMHKTLLYNTKSNLIGWTISQKKEVSSNVELKWCTCIYSVESRVLKKCGQSCIIFEKMGALNKIAQVELINLLASCSAQYVSFTYLSTRLNSIEEVLAELPL